jgi:hypothetical protein
MINIRTLSLWLLIYPFSNFTMEQEKFGYSDDASSSGEWACGPALCFSGWPETISILNFDKERNTYFYQRLFEDLDLDGDQPELKLAVENKDQVRINLGPLKYFALRMLVDDKQMRYSFSSKGYIPSVDRKVIEDLGPIKFNNKRGVEYHEITATQLALLIEKKKSEREEEWVSHADIMNFDPVANKYCYEPLFEEDLHENGILVLSKNAPKIIDLGPLRYFAVRKTFHGRNNLPAQGQDEGMGRAWQRFEELTDREEQLGRIEKVPCKGLNGGMEEKDYHAKQFNEAFDHNECEVFYSSEEIAGEDSSEDGAGE